MKRFITLSIALAITTSLLADNVITYTASEKLSETTIGYESGLHAGAFNVSITSHTFSNGIGTITFSGDVTSIGMQAFNDCSVMTSITLPNSITSIGFDAFSGCTGLTYITIPNSTTSIEGAAFFGCSGLTSIEIPNSVTSIGGRAFGLCSGLTSIAVESGNIVYDSRDNCNAIIETATNSLLTGCKTTIIPNSVTSISPFAFEGCSGLTSIEIPNSVTSIKNAAFSRCTGLTSITIPNSVTSIEKHAFNACSSLTSITLPNSVTSIEEEVFYGCSGLISIYIPNSVTSIGKDAFVGCIVVRDIYSYATVPPTCNDKIFKDLGQFTTTLHVPAESVEMYRTALGWRYFYNIVAWNGHTAVENVSATEEPQKIFRDGHFYIQTVDGLYTIDGRRVE